MGAKAPNVEQIAPYRSGMWLNSADIGEYSPEPGTFCRVKQNAPFSSLIFAKLRAWHDFTTDIAEFPCLASITVASGNFDSGEEQVTRTERVGGGNARSATTHCPQRGDAAAPARRSSRWAHAWRRSCRVQFRCRQVGERDWPPPFVDHTGRRGLRIAGTGICTLPQWSHVASQLLSP